MIINSSQISMDASTGHKDVSRTATGRILSRNHSGRQDPHFNLNLEDVFSTSASGNDSLTGVFRSNSSVTDNKGNTSILDNSQVLSRMISGVTGAEARIRRFNPDLYQKLRPNQTNDQTGPRRRFFRIGGKRFSMFFSSVRTYCEYEYYNYNCNGKVSTGDGRNIDFSLNISLQRSTMVQETVMAGATSGYLVDPLVLDFEGALDTLFEQPFLFDLDGDGSRELIRSPGRGCGFLALDCNDNNLIDDGTELFGPLRGSGFADLGLHDDDNNLWIDENDAIFDKLLVWMNPSGNGQQLLSLKEAGVGAISLTNAESLFNLKSGNGDLLGQVDATGIFLTEGGEAKSIRDIQLSILDEKNEQDAELFPVLREAVERHRRQLEALVTWQQRKEKSEDKSKFEQFIDQMLSRGEGAGSGTENSG